MMSNKKSSISLSMEAIIVIIIAITLLGLGLTFIRNIFSDTTKGVEEIIEGIELSNPATSLQPLTFPPKLELTANKVKKIEIGFYCEDVNGCDSVAPYFSECTTYTITTGSPPSSVTIQPLGSVGPPIQEPELELITKSTNVPARESKGFRVMVKWDTANVPASTICNLDIVEMDTGAPVDDDDDGIPDNVYKSAQIFIKVS